MLKQHLGICLTIEDLIDDPGQVETLSYGETVDMLARLVALQPILIGRLASLGSEKKEIKSDNLLNVAEASERLGMSPDWLYRHAKELPFTKRIGPRQLRFSEAGIEKYIKNRSSYYMA
jgi:predicted DNA-binding transcriptional regulator AlpA